MNPAAQVHVDPELIATEAGGIRNNREFGESGPGSMSSRRGLEGIFDVAVEIPIFNRNQGGVKAARAGAEHTRLQVERTRLALKARLVC